MISVLVLKRDTDVSKRMHELEKQIADEAQINEKCRKMDICMDKMKGLMDDFKQSQKIQVTQILSLIDLILSFIYI